MPPLNISLETAQKLAKQLRIPVEHVLHMPRHILLAKLAEAAAKEREGGGAETKPKPDGEDRGDTGRQPGSRDSGGAGANPDS